MSNNVRSTKLLESEGYLVDVVERRLPHAFITKDLFGFGDLIAIRDVETLLVQTTSAGHVSDRIKKIIDSPHLAKVRKANWRIEVHGWAKLKNRWTLKRREDIS